MKICNKCLVEKENDEFYSKRSECIVCSKEYRKLKYRENPETQKERSRLKHLTNPEYYKQYRDNNKDKVNGYAKSWRDKNPQKSVETTINWRESNKEKYNQYQRLIRLNSDLIRLSSNIRNRTNKYLKKLDITKKNKTFEIVGCTPEFLKEYLEKQFVDGMDWKNRNKWHIDHIVPLSSAKTEEELYKLCHYTNLQPLWVEDNLKKSDKILN